MKMKKKYPPIVCADGFRMSVQASSMNYSEPRNDVGPYSEVEVGYPSEYDMYLAPYAEEPARPTETVYGYVPVHVVQMVIDARGGIVEGELPPLRFDPSLSSAFPREEYVKP